MNNEKRTKDKEELKGDNVEKPLFVGESLKVREILQMRQSNLNKVPSLPLFSKATNIQKQSIVKTENKHETNPVKVSLFMFLVINIKSKSLAFTPSRLKAIVLLLHVELAGNMKQLEFM